MRTLQPKNIINKLETKKVNLQRMKLCQKARMNKKLVKLRICLEWLASQCSFCLVRQKLNKKVKNQVKK